MEINVRTLLPFLLFYFLKESSAQTVHNVFTYTSKLMEELECTFTSTVIVQWTEQKEDGLPTRLFLYDVTNRLAQKQTTDSKYDNFNYSIEGTDRFNLVIKNVEQGDEGRYQCNPITADAVTFDVTVEVLPKSMNINCTESNVCMPSAGKETVPKITCVCTATEVSSSQLEIEWDGVDITSTSSTAYGSSSITSEITLRPPNGTSGISCSLRGYRSRVPERLISYSYTFSPPVCTLMSECPSDGTSASLICSCSKGSPSKGHGYSFYDTQMLLIGTQLDSSLQVNSDKNETFYCKGCNGVLHDQFVSHALNCSQAKSSALLLWILIIFGILLLLLVVAAIFLVKARHEEEKRKRRIQHEKTLIRGGVKAEPEGDQRQVERTKLLNDSGDKQNLQGNQDAGNTTPTQSGGPAPKEHKKPDNKSTSAGSGGVGPGKVRPQTNATNTSIAQEKPPIPKKRGENNITAPSQSSVPAPKVDTEPDNKSISAGSGGVGPGEVTGHQNSAGNENIEKKKPPVEPKKKGENKEVTGHQNSAGNENIEKKKPPVVPKKKVENNMKSKQRDTVKDEESQSADNNTRTHGRDSTYRAPTTLRTQGDGRADTDTQGVNENISDSTSQTENIKESSEDLTSQMEKEKAKKSSEDLSPTKRTEGQGSPGEEGSTHPQNQNPGGTSVDRVSNDSNTTTDADTQQKKDYINSAYSRLN